MIFDGFELQNNGVPIYVQIRDRFIAAIAGGALSAGEQLPTMRQVAVTLKIDLNTVRHAYDELERQGAIRLERGRGSFVADQGAPRTAPDPVQDLAQQSIAAALAAGIPPAEVARTILRLTEGVR